MMARAPFFAYLVANVVKLRSKRERRDVEDEVLREMEVVELQRSQRRKNGVHFISNAFASFTCILNTERHPALTR